MENMLYKVGDLISFNGQYEEVKRVYFSGLCKSPNLCFKNETHKTKVLITQPHSKFKVKAANYPYYLCEKMWENGDEEIPVNAQPIAIHINEVIPYLEEWNGTVINKIENA